MIEIPAQTQTQSYVRRFFLDAIIKELRASNVNYEALLLRYGLKLYSNPQLYETIPLSAYIRFFEEAAEKSGRPFLGHELGSQLQLWEMGPLYTLMATAPNLKSALETFARFQATWQSHTELCLESNEGEITLSYIIRDVNIWPRIQDTEYAISALCSIVRQLTSNNWNPVRVSLEHSASGREKHLMRSFHCNTTGNANSNAIVLRSEDIERPIQDRYRDNKEARASLERHLIDLMRPPQQATVPLEDKISQLISRQLGRDPVTLEFVASELGLSERTLRRRLEKVGLKFSEILLRERMTKAENLIQSGDAGLEVIARRCGYANHSAFCRAYRDWAGVAPSKARTKVSSIE